MVLKSLQSKLFGPSKKQRKRDDGKRRFKQRLKQSIQNHDGVALNTDTDKHPAAVPFHTTDTNIRYEYAPIRYILTIVHDTLGGTYRPLWLNIGIQCSDGILREAMVQHPRETVTVGRYTGEPLPEDWIGYRVPIHYTAEQPDGGVPIEAFNPEEPDGYDFTLCSIDPRYACDELDGHREKQADVLPQLARGERAELPLKIDE